MVSVGCSGCVTPNITTLFTNKTSVLQREAFVKLETYGILPLNGPTKFSSGSGAVVKHNKTSSIILTAGHICDDLKEKKEIDDGISVDILLRAIDVYGTAHPVKIVANSSSIDACLVEATRLALPALELSPTAPLIGDEAFNFSAAKGIFDRGMILLFHGHYAGDLDIEGLSVLPRKSSVYTIPTAGGSSGSPILNVKGELIGMTYASYGGFEHLGIAITYPQLRMFLRIYLGDENTAVGKTLDKLFDF